MAPLTPLQLELIARAWRALAEFIAAWGWILVIAYTATIIATVLIVILDKRDPTKALLWVLVLILLPIGGLLLYIFFGQNVRRSHIFRRKVPIDLSHLRASIIPYVIPVSEPSAPTAPSPLGTQLPLARLLINSNRSPVLDGNHAQLFFRGQEAFQTLIDDLQRATRSIFLQYYIFRADRIGSRIARILREKASQGLDVRIIYDAVGSWGLPSAFVREMRRDGVLIHQFQKVMFPYLSNRLNYRNHRKIALIDGIIGHMGGMNVADKYIDGDPRIGPWFDTQLRIVGPAVSALQLLFANDWDFVTKYRNPIRLTSVSYPSCPAPAKMQIVASGPDTDWASIMQTFFLAIMKASRYIHICSPYFVPNESILTALKTASLSGVDVRILLPQKSDAKVVHWATRSYIQTLLEAGIRVFLFHAGFNHAKTVMVDGEFCAVGSANMDIRSFEDNFEVLALIYDPNTTATLEAEFQRAISMSHEVYAHAWRARPLSDRFKDAVARLFSPLF